MLICQQWQVVVSVGIRNPLTAPCRPSVLPTQCHGGGIIKFTMYVYFIFKPGRDSRVFSRLNNEICQAPVL